MKNYQFSTIVEKDKNGYFVSCPELQGCYSQGKTYEEAMKNIQDAIRLHIGDRIAEGDMITPMESVSLSTVHVAV